jgi:hypothetical protein
LTKTTASRAAALLLALAGPAAAAVSVPEPPRGRQAEYETAQRLFLRFGEFQPMAEFGQRWQYDGQRPYKSLTLGGYGRAHKHLKLGAFYRLQYGARHDDDWTSDPAGGPSWIWTDSTRRPEHVLLLDAFPRMNLTFLPGKAWIGSLKTRYERNFRFNEDMLHVQPELSFFWMDGLKPKATFFLRHETVWALNFGNRGVWQRWHYAAALWHPRPGLSFGPLAALREEVWSTSREFAARLPGRTYTTLYRAWVFGGTLVVHLD